MIHYVEQWARFLRRRMSRSEWAVKVLKLPSKHADRHQPGLLIIQVDGLSRPQLERALAKGRMPFLRHLLKREEYILRSFYSGVPSTTPAVQAELMYGVKGAVPAFHFYDRQAGTHRVMYEADSVNAVASELEADMKGLLKGGSSYSNIYAGGAEQARFCAQDLRLESMLRAANPVKLFLLLVLHFTKLFRMLGLLVTEFALAVVDVVRGFFGRNAMGHELKFIFSRIGVCILLRELVRLMVKMDLIRGTPIIHANFLGYDEQAHRRGPDSAFAHWSLKGIDGTLRDLFRTASRSSARHYHMLIFADHGQERTRDYIDINGRSIQRAVFDVLETHGICTPEVPRRFNGKARQRRAGHHLRLSLDRLRLRPAGEQCARVTAMGPVGHVYIPEKLSDVRKRELASALVTEAAVPLVLFRQRNGDSIAVNRRGEWRLPRDAATVVGRDHPFLQHVSADLIHLLRTRCAGDLMLSGWDPSSSPVTFAVENGGHGGLGVNETHGFVLHPPELNPAAGRDVVRPVDLRHEIQRFFRSEKHQLRLFGQPKRDGVSLRVVTYNVHSCIGMDGESSPERVAAVLQRLHPDVVALQEVDFGRARTNHEDQLRTIADLLNMHRLFFPLIRGDDGDYGIAILSRFPLQSVLRESYTSPRERDFREERGALWARILLPDEHIHVINTHLGLRAWERAHQAEELAGATFLGGIPPDEKVILCGDFNTTPNSAVFRTLTERLQDVQHLHPTRPRCTFFGRRPVVRIDHILISSNLGVRDVRVPRHSLALHASDHLPLFADIGLSPDGRRDGTGTDGGSRATADENTAEMRGDD